MAKKTDSQAEPRPRKHKDLFQKRQKQIISKATKLFMKKGYAQTTMREISKATGIDLRNLYYFIKSKDEILFLVCQMIHKPAMEIIQRPDIINMDDPALKLQTVFQGLLDFGFDYGEEILLMYREAKSLSKPLKKIIFNQESLLVSRVEEILLEGKKRNVFRFDDASFTANFLVYGLSVYTIRNWNMKKYSKKELMDLLINDLLRTVII